MFRTGYETACRTTAIGQPPNIVEWYTCAFVLLINLLVNFYVIVVVVVMFVC